MGAGMADVGSFMEKLTVLIVDDTPDYYQTGTNT